MYGTELENAPEFNGLNEWVSTFSLLRGKKLDDEDDDYMRVSGLFKVNLHTEEECLIDIFGWCV